MTDTLHLEHLGACRTAFEGAPVAAGKILFLGEDNPQSARPEHALFPYPPGCAGHRFCHDILGVSRLTYLATWRTNLCNPKWSMKAARARSHELLSGDAPWEVVVLVGRKVADAFNFTGGFFTTNTYIDPTLGSERSWTLVSLPHPSGRNLMWNDPRCAINARVLLTEVVPDYPWGEALAGAEAGA